MPPLTRRALARLDLTGATVPRQSPDGCGPNGLLARLRRTGATILHQMGTERVCVA